MSEAVFRPDRATYVRDHAWLAAVAMAGGMLVLWIIGNPHVWTGAVAGLGAVAFRGWYLMDEELAAEWRLAEGRLDGPGERSIALAAIARVRKLGSAVQIVTQDGHKHLIRYQAAPDDVRREIARAAGVSA
jgi:hypothetical protein